MALKRPNLLTPDQVASLLSVSVGTLANWRSAEFGPRFAKIGGGIRYSESDVLAWINENARMRAS